MNQPTTSAPAPKQISGFLVDYVKNVHGHRICLGNDVVLAPEWESLFEHDTFGQVRTIDAVAGTNGPVFRIGVLWFGFGGNWIRHYDADQLLVVSASTGVPHVWEDSGGESDRDERETAEKRVREHFEAEGINVLVPYEEREVIAEQVAEALGVSEQVVFDVYQDIFWEARVALDLQIKQQLGTVVEQVFEAEAAEMEYLPETVDKISAMVRDHNGEDKVQDLPDEMFLPGGFVERYTRRLFRGRTS